MNNKLSQIFLIDETKLKLYSDIARNVGIDKIYPYVYLAEPFYIDEILGEALILELKEQIYDQNISEENQALLLKIAPCLALYTQYLGLRGLSYSILEKGITKLKSENSESLSEKELAEFINSTKNNAELAKELLIKYLCNCRGLYPLWRPLDPCACKKYDVVKNGSTDLNREFHMYFPNKWKKNCLICG